MEAPAGGAAPDLSSDNVVPGSRDQDVVNPSVAEVRQGRLALGKLLGQLDLPESTRDAVRGARKAAEARWAQRLGRIRPRGKFGVAEAFKYLGMGATDRDLATAAHLLRESGFEELVFGDDLVAIAEKNGSSAIDALDLVVVVNRGIENLRVSSPRQKAF